MIALCGCGMHVRDCESFFVCAFESLYVKTLCAVRDYGCERKRSAKNLAYTNLITLVLKSDKTTR